MTMTNVPSRIELTPKHVRAARALLAWSQQDLAKAAGVGASTVADFERGSRTPIANNAQAIRSALEAAGICFLPTGAVIGPAVQPVARTDGAAIPVRWVSAQDLSEWADRVDGPASLPTLLAKLIQATSNPTTLLRFPSDESVRYAGWDGITDASKADTYIPQGRAGWELGAQRLNIQQKATEDYNKRTAAPSPLDPAMSTYIFVTPCHWPGKDTWAKARQDEGPWREVRVYDVDNLVHWIEQHPAVGLWIATRLNKRPGGTRELDDVWKEWSLATLWPLTEDLVLADRSEDSAEVLRWLRREPSLLSLRATSSDEIVAFFHATLSELPDEVARVYRARTLVVTTAEAARALANAPAPLILLLTEPEPGLARALVQKGHYVLLAYDERLHSSEGVRTLARPSREGITAALVATGIAEPRANALARDSARNLAVLRRMIPAAPGHKPSWADGVPPPALTAALLICGWDEASEGDRDCLSELAGKPYDNVVADLRSFIGRFDSPLQKIGTAWHIASPYDAWTLLSPFLMPADLDRFEHVAQQVLGAADPQFDIEPDNRWLAPIHGIRRKYSGLLRQGVGQVLILLALWGDKVEMVAGASRRADAIVARLLKDADARRWWSLSSDFRLLAEASPNAFLNAIEDSLDQNDPPIAALFDSDGDGPFATEHLSDLMWALESLAWSPDLMPRVSLLLARLDAIDTKPRKLVNGPLNSLKPIHSLWSPQTFARQEQRFRVLDLIRKHTPDTAWKLMLAVLPTGYGVSTPSYMPRWRDFAVDGPEDITWGLIGQGAEKISERLIRDVGADPQRWSALLDRLNHFVPNPDAALAALEAAESQFTHSEDRNAMWKKLRGTLHHHREFPDADWSLKEDVLKRLADIYERFGPSDGLSRVAWLFENAVVLPNPAGKGWEAEQRQLDAARKVAAGEVFERGGISGILALARHTDTAGYIGKALYENRLSPADLDALIEGAACSNSDRERDVAHGLIVMAFRDCGEGWAEALIARARTEDWGNDALMTILRALPIGRWTWMQVEKIGGETSATYWRRTPVLWVDGDADEIAYAIRHLIDVGRARHALTLASRRDKRQIVSSALLVEVLRQAMIASAENPGEGDDAAMFQYHVAEILTELDDRSDIDREAIASLEWNYLGVLEYSQRPAKVLLSVLAEQPKLFIDLLRAAYRPSEESGIEEPAPENLEQASLIADQAYRLFDLWNHIPGRRDDGTIDGVALENWIKEARTMAKAIGREGIADSKIGQMLSSSPFGDDGNWPAEPVREVLDHFRSPSMLDGFTIGKMNRRGVTSRMPGDGGNLERIEAEKYRTWAKAIGTQHLYTARALNELADHYERQAKERDEDAERRDWSI